MYASIVLALLPSFMRRAIVACVSICFLVFPMLAGAVRFPDVPGDHPYNSSIEALALEGVVTGNPDGNYYPARPVNRAEFLTMLYRATDKSSRSVSTSCFSDVSASAWYAAVVCDAAANGYVGGYPNGSFKPEQTVNRVEALKMLYKVFGFGILTGTSANEASFTFTDVAASSWYTTYISSSYRNGLLPIPGYSGSRFYPDAQLLRGEAAAYIWRAMNISGDFEGTSSSSSSRSSSRSQASSSSSSSSTTKTMQVDFPFSDSGNVDGRKTFVYTFPLTAATDVQIDVSMGTAGDKEVTCRLYLLGQDGLSEEYYIGQQMEATCVIRASLPKGSYQLEVRPEDASGSYEVFTKVKAGDGNDGFDEAILLQPTKPKGGQLAVSDIADWYKFTFTSKGTHTVQIFGDDVSCFIYPLSDVDLFGFSTPICGEAYEYPKGSYIVRVQRRDNVDASLTYSVQLD